MAVGEQIKIDTSRADLWAKANVGRRVAVVSVTVPAAYKTHETVEYRTTTGKTERGWPFNGRVIGYHEAQTHLIVVEPQEFAGWQPDTWEATGACWLIPGDVSSCWWVNANLSVIKEPESSYVIVPVPEAVLVPEVDLKRVRKLLEVTEDKDIEKAVKDLLDDLQASEVEIAEQKATIEEQAELLGTHESDTQRLQIRLERAESRVRELEQAQQRRALLAPRPSTTVTPPPPPPQPKPVAKKRDPRLLSRLTLLAREVGLTVEELENDPSFKRFSLIDLDDDKG